MSSEKAPESLILSFQGVDKRWPNGTMAMRKVGLDVVRGQFCVILGPSGAGKSTLLRCVNGLVTPTSGQVQFDGIPVTPRTLRLIRPRVAMVHQQFNLVARLPVMDNVLAGTLSRMGMVRSMLRLFPKADQRRACQLLAQVGLGEEHVYRRAAQLSGGQQQRVAIARAFINRPDLVLADEPVASLDPKFAADILTLLKAASRQAGATVLCSLHQVELACRFADRIVAMRDGRMIFDGSPGDLSETMLRRIYDSPAGDATSAETRQPHGDTGDGAACASDRLVAATRGEVV